MLGGQTHWGWGGAQRSLDGVRGLWESSCHRMPGHTGWPVWWTKWGKKQHPAYGEVRRQEGMEGGGRIWGARQACDPEQAGGTRVSEEGWGRGGDPAMLSLLGPPPWPPEGVF